MAFYKSLMHAITPMSHAMTNEVTNITGSNFMNMSPHSFNFGIVILNNKNIVAIKV